jgi:threonine aldolase
VIGGRSAEFRRESTPSFVNTLRRCHSTVRGLMNSSAPVARSSRRTTRAGRTGEPPGYGSVMEPMRRSLSLHAPLRRMPHRVLGELLDRLPPGTPPDGPDGPVAQLETRIAELLGTPRALFFPSGKMAQQVALRIHAERRGRWAFAAHPQSHLDVWEARGYAVVHGLRFHPVGDRHTPLSLADLRRVAEPLAALVLELPQRDLGGHLPDWVELVEQVDWAHSTGAAAHLDGARLWEAQPFYDRPHAQIAGLFDTVYVSLYKALEGIRGAVLAADAATIEQASLWQRRLGGLTDAWPLAAIALMHLDDLLTNMPRYRDHAVAIAAAINAAGLAHTTPAIPQTSLFHVHLPASAPSVQRAADELLAERDVHLFLYTRTAPSPRTCSFEISVGENAMEFAPDEVADLIGDLIRSACGNGLSHH